MFKHLLLPTDGSPLSDLAIEKGVFLARSVGAKVTGIHVMPKFHMLSYRVDEVLGSQREFSADARDHADKYLSKLMSTAADLGVSCDAVVAVGDHPYHEIIAEAESRGCDLIVMASHGRKGIQAVLLGSETHKVLTHTKIPVLVFPAD